MATIPCGNDKCDKRSKSGICSRAYPCSEFRNPTFANDTMIAAKILEQGNVPPLNDLHTQFIQNYKDEGFDVSICQDEVTITMRERYMTYGGVPMSEINRKENNYDD